MNTRPKLVAESWGDLMRVGYLLRMYPRFTQTFVVSEILELERQGASVNILSLRKPTDGRFHESICRVKGRVEYAPEYFVEARSKFLGAHWTDLRSHPAGYARAAAAAVRHHGADRTDLLQAPLVLRWAAKRNCRHVHVHFGTHEATVAYLAHLLGGLSYSMTLHAFDIFRDNVDRRLLAMKINASRFTVTVSEYNRRFMIENLPGVDAGKIRVNYNGIDLETFQPGTAPRRPQTIATVGRLIEKKGFIHLIRAIGHLRDEGIPIDCTIAGDGPDESALKDEIKKLRLAERVKLAGLLSQQAVRRLLSESEMFVLPCVRAVDGNVDALPTVLLEAMANGCPCISTALSGVPEIIENEQCGLLVEPEDVQGLAAAIKRLVQDATLRESLAAAGRRRVETRFDGRTNVRRMREWFSEALGESEVQTPPVRSTAPATSTEVLPVAECRP